MLLSRQVRSSSSMIKAWRRRKFIITSTRDCRIYLNFIYLDGIVRELTLMIPSGDVILSTVCAAFGILHLLWDFFFLSDDDEEDAHVYCSIAILRQQLISSRMMGLPARARHVVWIFPEVRFFPTRMRDMHFGAGVSCISKFIPQFSSEFGEPCQGLRKQSFYANILAPIRCSVFEGFWRISSLQSVALAQDWQSLCKIINCEIPMGTRVRDWIFLNLDRMRIYKNSLTNKMHIALCENFIIVLKFIVFYYT